VKTCSACGSGIPQGFPVCPKCGKSPKSSAWKAILLVCIGIAVGFALFKGPSRPYDADVNDQFVRQQRLNTAKQYHQRQLEDAMAQDAATFRVDPKKLHYDPETGAMMESEEHEIHLGPNPYLVPGDPQR
jgi:hypothetical protein